MSELRKDYFLDRWVIISEKRGKRPNKFKKLEYLDKSKSIDPDCKFCPGVFNIAPEVCRIGTKKEWYIRVIKNIFPAVDTSNYKPLTTKNKIFTSGSAYGYHEVIIDTNRHNKELYQYPKEHIKDLFYVFINRIKTLSKDPKIKYVTVFKNHKKEAGASIPHSHCQLIAYNHFPDAINEELAHLKKYNFCVHCRLIKIESKGPRLCFKNKSFVAIAPFASRFPYEIEFIPRRHINSLTELTNKELDDLSGIIRKALIKLNKLDAAYNLYVHNFPVGHWSHLHINIATRISVMAGFEFETDNFINTVYPENAAKFYRK